MRYYCLAVVSEPRTALLVACRSSDDTELEQKRSINRQMEHTTWFCFPACLLFGVVNKTFDSNSISPHYSNAQTEGKGRGSEGTLNERELQAVNSCLYVPLPDHFEYCESS